MVCGMDLHRRQITFDALEVESGQVWTGRVCQPDRTDAPRSKARPGTPSRQALRERPDRDLGTLREHRNTPTTSIKAGTSGTPPGHHDLPDSQRGGSCRGEPRDLIPLAPPGRTRIAVRDRVGGAFS